MKYTPAYGIAKTYEIQRLEAWAKKSEAEILRKKPKNSIQKFYPSESTKVTLYTVFIILLNI